MTWPKGFSSVTDTSALVTGSQPVKPSTTWVRGVFRVNRPDDRQRICPSLLAYSAKAAPAFDGASVFGPCVTNSHRLVSSCSRVKRSLMLHTGLDFPDIERADRPRRHIPAVERQRRAAIIGDHFSPSMPNTIMASQSLNPA